MNIKELYEIFLNSKGITTDTRKIEKGQMFFALKGEKFNANDFAQTAITQGAICAVVDELEHSQGHDCVLVDDVLKTLQQLANYHRLQFKIPVIGLTGSNGKTTNKELIARVLAKKYKVHATRGNLNNHIGVPLTLLSMPLDTEIAIVEMGANHQKEIEQLCEICEPTHGLITNIGKAHLEGFGGEEGVKKGKGELLDFLKVNGGTAFINENDEILKTLILEKHLILYVFFGKDTHSLVLKQESPSIVFEDPISKNSFGSILSGKYNFDNIQAAYAIGVFFNVDKKQVCEAIAGYNPDNNRSQIVEKGSNAFLMDAYNANPSSMKAAVENFGNLNTSKSKVVILGDMFELGEYTESEHADLGKLVATKGFETVALYGQNMRHALAALPNAYYFTDKFSLHNWLMDKHFNNTFFLIKGSRGNGLESVLEVM